VSAVRRPPARAIAGIPITVEDTWKELRYQKIGGRGTFADRTWEQVIDEGYTLDGRIAFVEGTARGAIVAYRKIHPRVRAEGGTVLPHEQRALIAMAELTRRRSTQTGTP